MADLHNSAADFKELHGMFPNFTNDELRQIPVLAAGERLEPGRTYLDLFSLDSGELSPPHGVEVGPDRLFVAKHACDYVLWNRLRGLDNPRRTKAPPEKSALH